MILAQQEGKYAGDVNNIRKVPSQRGGNYFQTTLTLNGNTVTAWVHSGYGANGKLVEVRECHQPATISGILTLQRIRDDKTGRESVRANLALTSLEFKQVGDLDLGSFFGKPEETAQVESEEGPAL